MRSEVQIQGAEGAATGRIFSCVVCGAVQNRRVIAHVTWSEPVLGPSRYELVRCRRCTAIVTDPMPTPDVLEAYYAAYKPTEGSEHRNTVLVDMHKQVWSMLRSHLPENPIVLDYGFGAGAFTKHLLADGVRVVAADFSDMNIRQLERWAADQARHVKTVNVSKTPIAKITDGPFDLIVMFQVIEHLAAPAAVLQALSAKQTAGGKLYIECPNQDAWFFHLKNPMRSLVDREYMYGSVSPPQHLVGFNVRALRMTIEGAGYRVLKIGSYAVADGVHAPENVCWYPTFRLLTKLRRKVTLIDIGKAVVPKLDRLARPLGLSGGLFALAEKA